MYPRKKPAAQNIAEYDRDALLCQFTFWKPAFHNWTASAPSALKKLYYLNLKSFVYYFILNLKHWATVQCFTSYLIIWSYKFAHKNIKSTKGLKKFIKFQIVFEIVCSNHALNLLSGFNLLFNLFYFCSFL